MRRHPLALLAVALVVAAVIWAVRDRLGGDARRINAQLERLQALVARSGEEGRIEGLDRARRIAALFAPEFEVRAEAYDFATRDRRELIAGIHRYRSRGDSGVMRIVDRELLVNPAARTAVMQLSARFDSRLPDLSADDTHHFELHWAETDGEWLIRRALLLEIERAP